MNRLNFLAGLPRSGSTLLANLLAQRADFTTTGTSGLLDVALAAWNAYGVSTNERAYPSHGAALRSLAAVLNAHHVGAGPVLDKNRNWPLFAEPVRMALGYSPRTVLCVRDVRDIAASFESLYQKRTAPWPGEAANATAWATTERRVALWFGEGNLIGGPLAVTREALKIGGNHLLVIDFADLVTAPREILRAVETFLELPPVEYKLEPIPRLIVENDSVWGMGPLHTTRPFIEPAAAEPKWPTVLGDWAERFGELNL